MEEQRSNGVEKVEEIMLPGFRFHPTDEELVGFYLKRKIQQRQLPIELIKQLDIYKFDPWDLPKLASTGEKEWYFYCPRDRKYRNSARPNRVTGAGFWKATGTDRPIYSSEGNKCIGLKKSLVFYRGRAAKGIKTDWMMHEFRLPSVPDSAPSKRFMDKSSLANNSWAICRIFKKTNSTAQRALSQSWVASPPLPQPSNHHHHLLDQRSLTTNDTKTANNVTRPEHEALLRFISTHHLEQYPNNVDHHLHSSTISHDFSSNLDHFPSFKLPSSTGDLTSSLLFSPLETLPPPRSTADVSSMIINMSSSDSSSVFERVDEFGGSTTQLQYTINGFPFSSTPSQVMQVNGSSGGQWENITSTGGVVPFGLPVSSEDTNWRLNNLLWDSSASLPSEVSSSFSTNKCYT